jgi:DNA-binding CsgD family transcriptional regulator
MPRKSKSLDLYQQTAHELAEVTGQPVPTGLVDAVLNRHNAHKNPAAVALGKLGGAKGGNARAASLSAKERRAIAQKGAATRWDRERRIADMLARGISAREIEKRFGVKPGTLRAVIQRLEAKALRQKSAIPVHATN